ncbi:MAG TPA: DUF2071 domain-containing protein [Pyrinomonadaceae bacterium]|jgi:hypothetical protein|nr:DUF2071 domain-containing protein [Pyrinomonadaceae bacterium]
MKKFLTAEWRDLVMVNYEVDPSRLEARVPNGTELDLQDGKCFVSLVGFMFLDTRVRDFLIPFHVNFEEVNLRFYVKRATKTEVRRGVVFIKEFVPRAAIAFAARALYDEPYEAVKMLNKWDTGKVKYWWAKGKSVNAIKVSRGEKLGVPEPGSHEEFIIEHYWGYTKRSKNRTDEYKVEHPKWELYKTRHPKVCVNFSVCYGSEFAFLRRQKPYSVLLAKGSEVSVYKGEKIV